MSVAQRSGWTWQSQRRERSNGPRALPSSRRFPIATTTAPSPGSPGAPPGRSRSRACGISQRLAPRPNSAMHTPLRNAPPRAQCVASATTFKPRSTKTNLDQRKRNDPSRGSFLRDSRLQQHPKDDPRRNPQGFRHCGRLKSVDQGSFRLQGTSKTQVEASFGLW
jgi:hypothetical protein